MRGFLHSQPRCEQATAQGPTQCEPTAVRTAEDSWRLVSQDNEVVRLPAG